MAQLDGADCCNHEVAGSRKRDGLHVHCSKLLLNSFHDHLVKILPFFFFQFKQAIISIAIEDGNYLQEAWEHVLTCLSRFEHLQLLGEGAPPDASFFAVPHSESEDKLQKSQVFPSFKKKGNALQNPAVMAAVRGGSYDSTTHGVNTSGLVTPEQINNFISNLNLLEQIGNFELNHIFAHSQRLNGDAIVAFVKALCKVSMAELQSPSDPRVFSLTKIVEIA